MIIFLKKSILFILILLLSLEIFARIAVKYRDFYFTKKLSWHQVYERILKSKSSMECDTLVIGDSVGNQLCNFYWTDNYLATTGSITAAGYYILASNAIQRNDILQCIMLVSYPTALGWYFENKKTYNGFVKPFFTFDNLKHLDELVMKKMMQKPFGLAMISYGMKILPFNDLDYSKKMDWDKLSDISIHYLKKIKNLCDSNGIEFYLISPYVSESQYKKTNGFSDIKVQVSDLGLEDIFNGYFENMKIIDDKYYVDHIHYNKEYMEDSLLYIRKYIYKGMNKVKDKRLNKI